MPHEQLSAKGSDCEPRSAWLSSASRSCSSETEVTWETLYWQWPYASWLPVGCEKLELYDYEKDSVEEIQVEYSDAVKDLPVFARNIGEFYELFAKGGTVDQEIIDFEQAVKMHKVIDKMEKSWENKQFSRLS